MPEIRSEIFLIKNKTVQKENFLPATGFNTSQKKKERFLFALSNRTIQRLITDQIFVYSNS